MAVLQSWWTVVLVIAFVGLVAWVFWPKRKRKMEEHGKIPLRKDDECEEQ